MGRAVSPYLLLGIMMMPLPSRVRHTVVMSVPDAGTEGAPPFAEPGMKHTVNYTFR